MKQVIVTGATGFIGSAFVNELARDGIQVIAVGRKDFKDINSDRKKLLEKANYVRIDMADISSLESQIAKNHLLIKDGCIFFNLAWGGENGKLSDLNTEAQFNNIIWSELALEVAVKMKCSKFIQIGSMEEIFAKKYLSLDFHFNMQWNRHVVYALAKTVAKNILSLRARELGIDYNYVNHSHVMGPGDEKDSFLQVSLQKIILGEDLIVSSGEQYFDVISLSDCVRGYKLICQKGLSGFDYWVGSGEAQRLKSYLERLRRIIPSDSQIKFGELAYNDVQVDEIEFSIDLLTRHTGYSPEFSFEETVLEVVKYLEKHNYTVGF